MSVGNGAIDSDFGNRVGRRSWDRWVAGWLILSAGMVFAMAVIGAVTRLTESGLSMVEWRPLIGSIPPLTEAEWQRVFDLYRETPEYRYKNAGMDLAGFKEIFFWEWFHRLWGRLIGLVYAAGFFSFLFLGAIRRGFVPPLTGLLVLGGLQGLMGWYMVQSGLIDRPAVSHYRLAAHLGLAFVIFSCLVWVTLAWVQPTRPERSPVGLRRFGWVTVAVLAITLCWGAFVAGLDAGLAYNTWPLMAGYFFPPESLNLVPAWLNLFDNTATVQFIHRWLAIAVAGLVSFFAFQVMLSVSLKRTRVVAGHLLGMVWLQVLLGISTLLLAVPVWLGALHQAGAFILLLLLLWTLWEISKPE